MKSVRLSDEARAAIDAAVDAATNTPRMTRAEEVKALMAKGLKIVVAQGHAVWAFAPRPIAALCGAPYSAAFPAAEDLAEYGALGGELIQASAASL